MDCLLFELFASEPVARLSSDVLVFPLEYVPSNPLKGFIHSYVPSLCLMAVQD